MSLALVAVQWLIEHSTPHQLLWCINNCPLRNPCQRKVAIHEQLLLKNINLDTTNSNLNNPSL